MDGLLRGGMPQQAMETFKAMRLGGLPPNLHVYTSAITAVSVHP
jgi:pentatricopeptide repeat protein